MESRRLYLWPIAVAGLLLACMIVWLGLKIPRGILTYPDELFTAERAREMLILGRGTVHYNFVPSFAKPPLQYWLTSFSLPLLINQSTAVRLWPLVYGALTVATAAWLAYLIDPKKPWLIPFTVAVLVSCPLISTESTHAMLDTGLMFFATLAIALAQLARRQPRWWVAVAIVCWLGALQKVPLILLIWFIVVAVRSWTHRGQVWNRWLIGSVLLSLVLISGWPVFQILDHGMPIARAFAGDDPNDLFGEGQLGGRTYFEVLNALVATGWAGGAFALLAAGWFFVAKKENVSSAIKEMSILSIVIIVLAIVFNFRSVRYVLPIVPCLCLVLAFFLYRLLVRADKVRTVAIVFACFLIAGGFVQAEIKMHHQRPDASQEQRVAQKLGALQAGSNATLLITRGRRETQSPAFYLFQGNLHSPLRRCTIEKFREAPPSGRVVGVCTKSDFTEVQKVYRNIKVEMQLGNLVCWDAVAP